jgi:ADP-ribosylglycohydrolase
MPTKQSIRRSMLWSAYGDALGFITEIRGTKMNGESILQRRTGSKERVTRLIPWIRRVGGEFGVDVRLMSGCYSDDTQLRLATCRSIRGDGIFDIETFSKIEIPVWISYALGAGRGTKTAAESLRKRQVQWNFNFFNSKYSQYTNSGGNGAAMRIQPHIWCASSNKPSSLILRDVIRNTITTHGHIRGIIGAAFHALCLHHTLSTSTIPGSEEWGLILDTLRRIPDIIRSDEELFLHWLPIWENETRKTLEEAIKDTLLELTQDIKIAERSIENIKAARDKDNVYNDLVRQLGCLETDSLGSATKTTLLAAFLSYIFHDRPHYGLSIGANVLGSDTDTISTMAGAILGATADIDPPEKVADIDYLQYEAERMFLISQGSKTTTYEYPDILYWQPPTSQLDTLGSYEGKWVIQGLGEAEPIGQPIAIGRDKTTIWQWFKLKFGQTVLLKRRTKVKTIPRNSISVIHITSDTISQERNTISTRNASEQIMTPLRQPSLWDNHRFEKNRITVDMAIERCKQSQFNADIIGSMFIALANQENGIEKSIGFAAIVAKYIQARMHKDTK